MNSGAIIQVICEDGPCQGLQYLDDHTGRVLFSDAPKAAACIYQINRRPGYRYSPYPYARLAATAPASDVAMPWEPRFLGITREYSPCFTGRE